VLTGMVAAGLCLDALSRFLGLARAALHEHIVRLDLRTPPDTPFRSAGARGWSDEDVQLLVAWRPIGVHPEAIGENLAKRRKAAAVRAKCRRIGLAAPPRKNLFRPDPTAPRGLGGPGAAADPLSLAAKCGRAAGPVFPDFDATAEFVRLEARPEEPPELGLPEVLGGTEQADPVVAEIPTVTTTGLPGRDAVPSGAVDTPTVSAEVGGTEQSGPAVAEIPTVATGGLAERDAVPSGAVGTGSTSAEVGPIPQTIEEVDFSDLTWIRRLRSVPGHLPAVWTLGMLMMSGLRWRDAAGMTGKSPAALRTIRTRIGIPVDPDREKHTGEFDIVVATATREKGGWIVRKGIATDSQRGSTYFWVRKNDRGTRLPPTKRRRDRTIEGRSPIMTIYTRAMLGDEAARYEPRPARVRPPEMAPGRDSARPFAEPAVIVHAS
jgi:hypothetical protein